MILLSCVLRKKFIAVVVFLCFVSYILQSNLISRQKYFRFKCTNEAVIGKSLKIANSDN